ncbi:putative ABC-type ATPase [Hymenobacter sp. UYAg731]
MANSAVPRLRMLAGPNGSGKSFLVDSLRTEVNLGILVNADMIEAQLKVQAGAVAQVLRLADWQLTLQQDDLFAFAARPEAARLTPGRLARMKIANNELQLSRLQLNSYLAAWIAEFLRFYLVAARQSMTFETVMSHESKLGFLREVRAKGYRTYLYYVATDDWNINIDRVRARVKKGGHNVSRVKIIDRYFRSLALLFEAVKLVDRAYIFDNSLTPQLIAEITNGQEVEYAMNDIPQWVYIHFHAKLLTQAAG